MFKEFREFAARGSVVDLAVGVIIGAAFGKIVTSAVDDLIMPPIGILLGRVDFKDLFVALNGASYPSLAAAKAVSRRSVQDDSSPSTQSKLGTRSKRRAS